ncbi:MAG TPA: hypothetical protein DCR03_11715 [Gammaproteobacteria bacterium]|jgi:glutamate-1-semialdehyde 2,1-aminomutase|nr:hypothetical protein [Gammaproteobacteria bacterium]|tara:strand:- start:465 stop:1838 length:1374 start_codon:yes stop_codon:yes gene_type:complete
MNQAETREKILHGEKSQTIRRKLLERTAESKKLAKNIKKTLAQEVVQTVNLPHPIYIDSANGPYLTDVDGNEYIDLTGGFGPNVLGNKPEVVQTALQDQIKKGWHFGIPGTGQKQLSTLIKEADPFVDQLVFCNSGTEATMYAMRAARAFTGKSTIALFDGSYHGVHDYALVKADTKSDRSRPQTKTLGTGVPSAIADDLMMVLPYRDDTTFELIREHRDELAMVVIEPVQSSNPRLDNKDFLQKLRAVCTENNVLLMFDEVITGFRIAYGGAKSYYDVEPDLVTYGKAIGGGLPIGAIGGKKGIMDTFSGSDNAPFIFTGGTFSGNPLTMSAGIAAIEYMKENKNEIYPQLSRLGDKLANEINGFCRSENIPAQLLNASSMFHLIFGSNQINSSRDIDNSLRLVEQEFYLHLLGHNVIVPGIHLAFLSWMHSEAIVEETIQAFQLAFSDLRYDGLV